VEIIGVIANTEVTSDDHKLVDGQKTAQQTSSRKQQPHTTEPMIMTRVRSTVEQQQQQRHQ